MTKRLFVLVLLAVIASIAPTFAQDNSVLRHATHFPLPTLDPHQRQQNIDMLYFQLMFEGLVTETDDGTIIPQLATSWEETDTAITFTLREGVVFHDGTPFNAQAVAANIDKVKNGSYGPTKGFLRAIESVDVLGDYQVRFNLTFRDPALLGNLARFAGLMLSPNSFATALETPIGTGPWQLSVAESVLGTSYVFNAFDGYWNPADQTLQRIESTVIPNQASRLNAFLAGEYDSVSYVDLAGRATLADNPNVKLFDGESAHYGLHFLDFDNTITPELGDIRVRQAMGYAIDNELIFEVVDVGTANDQRFFEGQAGYCEGFAGYDYNPERARELLAEAGVESLTWVQPASPTFAARNEAVAGFLAEVGLNVTLEPVDNEGNFTAPASGKYAMAIIPINEIDPFTFVRNRTATGFANPQGAVDMEIKGLLDEALTLTGDEAVAKITDAICKMYEKAYIIHIGAFSVSVATWDYVQGVEALRYFMPSTIDLRGVTLNR